MLDVDVLKYKMIDHETGQAATYVYMASFQSTAHSHGSFRDLIALRGARVTRGQLEES